MRKRITLASFFGFASLAFSFSPTLPLYAKNLEVSAYDKR